PGVLAAAAWPAIQRAAILGGVQRAADRVLPHFRVAFPRAVSCAVHSRFGRGAHEARGPQASRDRRGDRTPWPAAGMGEVNSAVIPGRPEGSGPESIIASLSGMLGA